MTELDLLTEISTKLTTLLEICQAAAEVLPYMAGLVAASILAFTWKG